MFTWLRHVTAPRSPAGHYQSSATSSSLIKDHVDVRVLPGEQILLLQGPMGAFFRGFTEWLEHHGADVWKINFNGGDWLFYPYGRVVDYRGPRQDWSDYLRRFLIQHRISRVYLYNDCRPYHRIAIETCRRLHIPVMVF
ncbi:MAG: hypothetical protein ACJ8LN_09565, partial [Sulfurifustis sp.]